MVRVYDRPLLRSSARGDGALTSNNDRFAIGLRAPKFEQRPYSVELSEVYASGANTERSAPMNRLNRDASFVVSSKQRVWWRTMSLRGWAIFLFGVIATVFLIFGLASGEALFILSPNAKSGPIAVARASSALWYWVLMICNLTLAVMIWACFFSWLKSRRK